MSHQLAECCKEIEEEGSDVMDKCKKEDQEEF